jgi:hypothetical protein
MIFMPAFFQFLFGQALQSLFNQEQTHIIWVAPSGWNGVLATAISFMR